MYVVINGYTKWCAWWVSH